MSRTTNAKCIVLFVLVYLSGMLYSGEHTPYILCMLLRLQQCQSTIKYFVCCRGSSNALNGCINDAHCMMFLLKSRFQFQDSDFRVLTDDQASPSQWPTRANMFEGFRWLAADARPGDSLVFHYSGQHHAYYTFKLVSGSVLHLYTCIRQRMTALHMFQAL